VCPRFAQEVCVVLLDVGAQMGEVLEPAAKTVSELIHGKVQHERVAFQLHIHLVSYLLKMYAAGCKMCLSCQLHRHA
jgi:hypothetical protein